MSLTIALQMDPLASINPHTDTTLLLGEEAARRGYALFHYVPSELSLMEGQPAARARRLTLHPGEEQWYSLEAPELLPLSKVDVVLLRQDPPFDMAYITSTFMLERAQPRTLVLNDPAAVRNHPEKLFPFEFPDFIPPTLISADINTIKAFHAEHGDIVLKPLYGFGGGGVFRIQPEGENFSSLLETMLSYSNHPLVVQRFIPKVMHAERRIILIDGQIKGIFGRIPVLGEIRSNLHLGNTLAPATITSKQHEIGTEVGRVLKTRGILFAGLDVIDDYLIEINITSPGGFNYLKDLNGDSHPERDFWDAAERKLAALKA